MLPTASFMHSIFSNAPVGMSYSLFYLANPAYGGWVSFTAHMALKYKMPLFKIGNRTEILASGEPKMREYGYGAQYRNVAKGDIAEVAKATHGKILITAIDKNFYHALDSFPNGTFIVIHDPTEINKKNEAEILDHLRRFRIITIRESVKTYLKKRYDLDSTFIIHPFYAYEFKKDAHPDKAVSISRIDFDKHTDIILEANARLPAAKAIDIYGFKNNQYVFFKLKDLHFDKYYKGGFEKSFEELNNVLKSAKYCVDMSVIKGDGGGSQYTFLEAIHNDCALVINQKWISEFKTVFKPGVNCFVVADGEELAALLKKDPPVRSILKEADKILEPHLRVNWPARMDAIGGGHGGRGGRSGTRKAAKHGGGTRKTRRTSQTPP